MAGGGWPCILVQVLMPVRDNTVFPLETDIHDAQATLY